MFCALFGLLATAAEGSRLAVSLMFIMVVMPTVGLVSPCMYSKTDDGRVHGGVASSWKQLKMAFWEYAFLACVFAGALHRHTCMLA